jgi:hypothetical protein
MYDMIFQRLALFPLLRSVSSFMKADRNIMCCFTVHKKSVIENGPVTVAAEIFCVK